MKIIFFGTPEFAIPPLKKIIDSGHEVAAVVTAPDKERGRGRSISFTPVKKFALEKNIPLLQPESLRSRQFISELKNFNADLFVVVAFRILPEDVYTMPPKGAINLHGSLLPKYRGAAPIQWAIINGESETGLTTFFLEKKVDTGKIILQKIIAIGPEDDLGSMHDKMSILGAELILETVELIDAGKIKLQPQDDTLASPAPKIKKDMCKINWNAASRSIHNLVRGLSPYPCAFFVHKGKSYKIFKTKIIQIDKIVEPGEIIQTKKEIIVGCSDGVLQILEIQPEGRKKMTAEEFLRGYSL